MTSNNINNARNPITGMTISGVAAVKRHLATADGQRKAQEFQAEWDEMPAPTGWGWMSLESQLAGQRLEEIKARMNNA